MQRRSRAGAGEYVVFLNNDTAAGEGPWLDALVSYAEANEDAAVVGARLLYQNGTIQHAGIVFGGGPDPAPRLPHVPERASRGVRGPGDFRP